MVQKPKKVLLLGSGGLTIGQAGEFDYSGSQALKALKEEGCTTVLINPNIATVQTSEGFADTVYFLPINEYFVEKIIEKEKPDGILLSFGGQTALNVGLALAKAGILEKHKVEVLGTPVKAIEITEDRGLFVKCLDEISAKTPKSTLTTSVYDAVKAADKIGYPVMVRAGFALGGLGSGACHTKEELVNKARSAFATIPQLLIEEYLGGWKEIEYEVVRDKDDNCITVCNMENFDPLGIHTGESIVVAPSQTLSNHEYHKLREISIRVIRHLGIVGECNIQFALSTTSGDYRIIEVNARLSRSSALASKATGYPLAFVAAKLSLGYTLPQIPNSVTKSTSACFEPSLDYLVLKIPRWDLKKFKGVSTRIGSEMKSVGEVMAIGRTFEEVIQKGIRMLGIGKHGFVANKPSFESEKAIEEELKNPTESRIFAIAEALQRGIEVKKIADITKIDRWFLDKLANIVATERELHTANNEISPALMVRAKIQGFSDFQIARLCLPEDKGSMDDRVKSIRKKRIEHKILPVTKQIDTLAAEYPAKTNYLYLTYSGTKDDAKASKDKGIIVMGSGPYRIGSSVEFDWCAVNAALTLRKDGYRTIMINCNPETVSTDYDMCDVLYFEELTYERVLDVYEKENADGVIISMGGQTPNNLSQRFLSSQVKILGTAAENIDSAENRHKFSALLDKLGIDQPSWKELTTLTEAKAFAEEVGYPVLVRPSYVLSGAAMNVAYTAVQLENYIKTASELSKDFPVVISKFIMNAKEIEIDAVAKKGEILLYAISEHVENAGVHSGDACMILPAQSLYTETVKKVKTAAQKIAKALSISGPFNIQFIAQENQLKVIECNLRASRSFPFVSKILKKNFIEVATRVMTGNKIGVISKTLFDINYVGVKAPQFSFMRLRGADPVLGVEMASTGEVACIGADLQESFLKSLMSAGFRLPKKNVFVTISGDERRYKVLSSIQELYNAGFSIYATEHTSNFLTEQGIKNTMLSKIHEKRSSFFSRKKENVYDYMAKGKFDMVIDIPEIQSTGPDETLIRRLAIDFSIPLLTDPQLIKLFSKAITSKKMEDLSILSWQEYGGKQK